MEPDTLKEELRSLLNRHSRENASNTPDFILAEFMLTCLAAFEHTSRWREEWYGRFLTPAGPVTGGKFGDGRRGGGAVTDECNRPVAGGRLNPVDNWPRFITDGQAPPRAGQYYVWDGEKPVWRDPPAGGLR